MAAEISAEGKINTVEAWKAFPALSAKAPIGRCVNWKPAFIRVKAGWIST